ncbi:hypothetical protein CDJ58_03765 [Campylobacter lari]|uniref:Uncharacterized protein n=1 Tax=Campylobacter peloridis TaxID=488546 RepID=A0A5C7DRU6_9BACT|nr:hypothetical protein [Campylobacter peloridis]EAH8851046.1 hypothetical protein [Campylobacter lari]EAI7269764.1 hypothetical protein [Campylobacter lari]EAK5748516.1 hypothetical protein [Campylobacter lari]EAK5787005.1 hypothetical protein [Campylobacter lari]EAK9878173.1 hypothetical protein [Campylobacter lari]
MNTTETLINNAKDLTQEVIDTTKEVSTNLMAKFKKYKEDIKNSKYILNQNKIDINDNDSYADKGFFAFLADLLKIKENQFEHNSLISELWKNERLSREVLSEHLKEQLDKYSNLEKSVLREKNLEYTNFDKLKKNIENEKLLDLASNILEEKIKEFKKDNPHIQNIEEMKTKEIKNIKDIQPSQVISIADNIHDTKNIAKNIIKKR